MGVNLTSPKSVRELLAAVDLRPGKSLGQNFLVDRNILDIILSQAEPDPEDAILEVGPGLGVLTEQLLASAGRVIAVEKDRKLYEYLADRFGAAGNLELVHADALDLPLEKTMVTGIDKVVSNLPYSAASRIMVDIFKSGRRPGRIVATLQTDVAERIVAEPGGKHYGIMAILARRFYAVQIVKKIGPNCFLPRPRVASALLVCELREKPLVEVADEEFFVRLVKMAFTHRRKMIVNALRGAGFELESIIRALCAIGVDERLRPAQLTVEDWGRLSNALR